MAESQSGDPDVSRALELVDRHLSEAEHILWEAAAESDQPDQTTDIEGLTQDLWAIQQKLHDIQDDRGPGTASN